MTPQRAAVVMTVHALASDGSASGGLRALASPEALRAAALLEAGQLAAGLRHLGVDPALGKMAELWPKALGPALARLESLPSTFHFRVQLGQTLVQFTLVAIVQVIVSLVLSRKAMPSLESTWWSQEATLLGAGLFTLTCVPFIIWVMWGAVGWQRLPGWGRHFARAKEAALAAAVSETHAPEQVRANLMSGFRVLRAHGGAISTDFDDIFHSARIDALRAQDRFLTAFRVIGFTFLTVSAAAMAMGIYGRLPQLMDIK